MSTTVIKAAIVGLGWWGQTIAASLSDSQVIRPVLGVDPEAGPRAAATAKGLPTVGTLEEALARTEIEAVILCTPQDHHADQIIAAAGTGRHVFCEKPLCTTAHDAERAIAAVTAAGVQLGIGHERRFEPAVIELRRRLSDGEFGRALMVEANFSQDKFLRLPPDNWRLSQRLNPVGPLSATGIHLVDLSVALLGTPTTVWARLATLGSSFENGDTLSITLGFAEGTTAMLTAILATPFMGRLALLGTKGWMEIRDRAHPETPSGWDVTRVASGGERLSDYYPPHPAVRDNLEAFGRAARGEASYPVSYEEMRAGVRVFEAVQRSVRSGNLEPV
jgi:predicted dehydrogenase